MADGQVRDDVVVPALERRECRERPVDALGQGAEGGRVSWGEPEHLLAEPVGAVEPEPEPGEVREELFYLGEDRCIDCVWRHEWGEHRDVSGDAQRRIGV